MQQSPPFIYVHSRRVLSLDTNGMCTTTSQPNSNPQARFYICAKLKIEAPAWDSHRGLNVWRLSIGSCTGMNTDSATLLALCFLPPFFSVSFVAFAVATLLLLLIVSSVLTHHLTLDDVRMPTCANYDQCRDSYSTLSWIDLSGKAELVIIYRLLLSAGYTAHVQGNPLLSPLSLDYVKQFLTTQELARY